VRTILPGLRGLKIAYICLRRVNYFKKIKVPDTYISSVKCLIGQARATEVQTGLLDKDEDKAAKKTRLVVEDTEDAKHSAAQSSTRKQKTPSRGVFHAI
jgi:hypothetical protein